jgi:hypothetical protein
VPGELLNHLKTLKFKGRASLPGHGEDYFFETGHVNVLQIIQVPALTIPYQSLGRVRWH